MIILFSIIMTTNVYAHNEAKSKIVFGKKCTVSEEGIIISSYIWFVDKDKVWTNQLKKENCNK